MFSFYESNNIITFLGQILHHLGVEIELKSIDIHNSEKEQGLALNYIGQILKGYEDEQEKLNQIKSLLNVDLRSCQKKNYKK